MKTFWNSFSCGRFGDRSPSVSSSFHIARGSVGPHSSAKVAPESLKPTWERT